jgi:hypothetical protein
MVSGHETVSREGARAIAEAYVAQRDVGARRVRNVCALNEATPAPTLYDGPDLSNCWIAYVDTPLRGLQSSTIVLVSRDTGEVLYAGSANDEG